MSRVKWLNDEMGIIIESPYSAPFVADAKKIGGKWNSASKTWVFDSRDEERIGKILLKHYGETGRGDQPALVDLRIPIHELQVSGGEATFMGRSVARRRGRDYPVALADGVIIDQGGFPQRGGSMKYPGLAAEDGTVLIVRDFPQSMWEQYKKDYPVNTISVISQKNTQNTDTKITPNKKEATSLSLSKDTPQATEAKRIHELRPRRERAADESRMAAIVVNPNDTALQIWARHKRRIDMKGIDTPPEVTQATIKKRKQPTAILERPPRISSRGLRITPKRPKIK